MFEGCGTALVTPFKQDLSLDEETLRALVRRQIADGIHFLVPCGTTGESPTLTHKEHLRVVEITLEEAKGKAPVMAGCGGYSTAEVIELAKELEALGADGGTSTTTAGTIVRLLKYRGNPPVPEAEFAIILGMTNGPRRLGPRSR